MPRCDEATKSEKFSWPTSRSPRRRIWSPDDDDQIRLHVEREVGQLDFGSFVASSHLGTGAGSVQAGNPDLVPQQDWLLEGTYERHFKGVVGVLTYRHYFIQNAIDRIPIYSASGVFDAPDEL